MGLLLLPTLVSATGSITISSVSIPTSVTQGDTFTITMSVSGSSVTGISGSLTLPSGLSCTPSGTQSISLSGQGTGSASWSCTASVAGDYTNKITASVTATDSGTGQTLSDQKQTGLTVLTPASLTVSSTVSSSSVGSGNTVTFTVGVNNAGDSSTTFNISLSCPSGLSCSPSSVANTGISGKSLVNNQFTITGNSVGSYTLAATVYSPVQSALATSQALTVTGSATTATTSSGGGGGPSSNATTTTTSSSPATASPTQSQTSSTTTTSTTSASPLLPVLSTSSYQTIAIFFVVFIMIVATIIYFMKFRKKGSAI